MKRSVPQVISLVAIVAGVALFVVTMLGIDRTETVNEVRRLGVLLPIVLLPSIGWHLLRAAGWYICFPIEERPSYWRVFRVRLAADAGWAAAGGRRMESHCPACDRHHP